MTPRTAARQATLSITNPRVYSNSCPLSQCCHPTTSSSVVPFSSHLQPFPASGSNESVLCIRWPKYWSFSFSMSPSNEYSGLISFRMNWLDLLFVQGTLKSLQHHSSKASILQHSTFFIVQLSHPYIATGKTTPTVSFIKEKYLFFFFLMKLITLRVQINYHVECFSMWVCIMFPQEEIFHTFKYMTAKQKRCHVLCVLYQEAQYVNFFPL